MKGVYKTKEGSKVEVIDFDEANKIAMIKLNDSQNKWVDEAEYSTWEKEEENDVVIEQSDESDLGETVLEYQGGETEEQSNEENSEEKPKRKRTIKKK